VQDLIDIAERNAPAAVGSIVRGTLKNAPLLSVGVAIDAWRFLTSDLLVTRPDMQYRANSFIEVDALSGRGVLYPYSSIVASGGMRPKLLPHYLADYELSLRVHKLGWRLLVSHTAPVYSEPNFGSGVLPKNAYNKFFSIRSPSYLPALILFWWGASTWLQRVSLPLRLLLLFVFPKLRRSQV
jgi:N-acetylglucosaminyl-diphospho-decaprenol L-rhamnosyltransferase